MPSGAIYELVPNGNTDANEPDSIYGTHGSDLKQNFTAYGPRKLKAGSVIGLVAVATAALACGLLCLTIFQQAQESCRVESSWLAPPGPVKTTFEYQKIFALRTSNETRERWRSLFPSGGGFVKHPIISPEMASLAIYHQLHCLNTIREAYWAALDGIEAHHHISPPHVRHCIDYLRQALLCHADASFEPPDMDLGGVTGFGVERKCRDVSKLRSWAEEWTASNGFHGD